MILTKKGRAIIGPAPLVLPAMNADACLPSSIPFPLPIAKSQLDAAEADLR